MKVSTRGRYGVNAAFELAIRCGEGPIPIKVIADAQQLSESYLEQLMAKLRKAGIVNSARGAQGGYELTRHPGEITVGEVLYAVEGPMVPADCLLQNGRRGCIRKETCAGRIIWGKIYDGIRSVIDTMTLADLIEEKERIERLEDNG
ncbi:MAG: RrF2 family transcriptional regulator [Christensenellales bacterium]|jgi:Rrf2 family protein